MILNLFLIGYKRISMELKKQNLREKRFTILFKFHEGTFFQKKLNFFSL